MDERAGREAMLARLNQLNTRIGEMSGVQTLEALNNLRDWAREADQLEEMLFSPDHPKGWRFA